MMVTELEQMRRMLSNPKILFGCILVLLPFALVGWWLSRRSALRKKRKEKAIAAKRTILAKRVKSWYTTNEDGNNQKEYHALYEYEADGKTYRYSAHSDETYPPSSLWLYYTKSPKRAFSDYDRDAVANLFAVVLLILGFLGIYLIMKLLGIDEAVLNASH